MSPKAINNFELLYVATARDGFNRTFIVYYVTTNEINFYRMNYPIDSILEEKMQDPTFDTNKLLLFVIEKRHHLHKQITFEQLQVNMSSWGKISFDKAHQYNLQQQRDKKINQIL